MFLEEWIHNKIRLQAEKDPEGHKRVSGDLQHITTDMLRDYQLFKLKSAVNHVYSNSTFYRELYNNNGFTPEDLRSLDDMAKIPFTTAENLWESPYRLLCVSLSEIDRIFTRVTSGTTGHPKRILFSGDDLE